MKWNEMIFISFHFISFETGFSFSQKMCKLMSKFVVSRKKMSAKTPWVYQKKCFSKKQNPTEKRKKTFFEKPKKYQNPISILPKKRHLRQKKHSWYWFCRFFIVERRKPVSNEMKWNEMSLISFHFIWDFFISFGIPGLLLLSIWLSIAFYYLHVHLRYVPIFQGCQMKWTNPKW
mgnify:CR=1 FL=1